MGTNTRVCRACSPTAAVIFLFAQTHFIQCCPCTYTGVCSGRRNSTPPFLLRSPCRGLVNNVRPSRVYLRRFSTAAPEMCLSATQKRWLRFRFDPVKQVGGSPAFVFLEVNDCVHSHTPTNQRQDHVGDHSPAKLPRPSCALIGQKCEGVWLPVSAASINTSSAF